MASFTWAREAAEKHIGLVVTLAFFGVAGMRIFGVSRFDLQTALGLANAAGLPAVVFATSLWLAQVIPIALILWALFALGRPNPDSTQRLISMFLLAGGLVYGLLVLSVGSLLTWGTVATYFALARGRARRGADAGWFTFATGLLVLAFLAAAEFLEVLADFIERPWGLLLVAAFFFVLGVRELLGLPSSAPETTPPAAAHRYLLGVVALVLVWSATPWLASEVITVNGRRMVGYVVEENGPWVTFLDESARTLSQIASSEIESRVVCVLEKVGETTWDRITGFPPGSPECDDV